MLTFADKINVFLVMHKEQEENKAQILVRLSQFFLKD
jgi:phosphoribosylaminoimidazole-succinocarboxamide synthase